MKKDTIKYNACNKIIKSNKWVHITLGIFTYGAWILVYFYCKSFKAKIDKENSILIQKEIEENKIDYLIFKLVGTTFENRQNNIKTFVREQIEQFEIEPYEGMTNRQIIESYNDRTWEVSYQKLNPDFKLEKYDFEGEAAIKVLFKTEKGFLDIGNIPREYVKKIDSYCFENNYKVILVCQVLGGKYKEVVCDDYGKDKVEVKELNYGIEIMLDINKQ